MAEIPVLYGSAPQSNFESQYHRIFLAAKCRTQVELAEFLGIRQSSISDAKKRQSIPAEWLLKLLLQKGVHPEWILTGNGARFMQPSEVSLPPASSLMDIQTLLQSCEARQLAEELVRRCSERAANSDGQRRRWPARMPRKPRHQER